MLFVTSQGEGQVAQWMLGSSFHLESWAEGSAIAAGTGIDNLLPLFVLLTLCADNVVLTHFYEHLGILCINFLVIVGEINCLYTLIKSLFPSLGQTQWL